MGKPDALSRRSDYQVDSKATDAQPRALLRPDQFVIPDSTTELPAYLMSSSSPPSPSDSPESNATSDTSDILARIQRLQPEDDTLKELMPYLRDPSLPRSPDISDTLEPFSIHNDLIYYANLIFVPDDSQLKLDLCHSVHNSLTAGHPGQAKTHDLLSRHYYFPGLRKFVNTYVNGCHSCQRNKTPRHKPFGPLQPLPAPTAPWRSITMDAIVKLPVSNGNDSIMVFVDRFTKQAHFIPFSELGLDSPKLATLFRQHIVRLHGIPTDIVSDRGAIFTSHFWRSFVSTLGIKPNFSTAFRPQSDGQTERVNQTVETYLRSFANYDQSNWSNLIDLAEFSYNNSLHSSTHHTPFEALYGYHPLDPTSDPTPTTVPAADSHLRRLRTIHAELIKNLQAAQASHARYYNRKVLEILDKDGEPRFKVGDLVFLNGKNIRSARPSAKLDHRMLGPFPIIGTTPSPLAFKLELPPTMSVHPVFHVNLLEPLRPGHPDQPQDPPPRIIVNDQLEYIVDRILNSRIGDDNGFDYLVHWQGYANSEDSWEPWEAVWDTAAYKNFRKRHLRDPNHHFPPPSAHRDPRPARP